MIPWLDAVLRQKLISLYSEDATRNATCRCRDRHRKCCHKSDCDYDPDFDPDSEHCDALGCATATWETVAKLVILRDPFGLRAKVKCGAASARCPCHMIRTLCLKSPFCGTNRGSSFRIKLPSDSCPTSGLKPDALERVVRATRGQ